MAAAVVGGEEKLRQRPIYGIFTTYQSPLVNTDEDLAKMLWAPTLMDRNHRTVWEQKGGLSMEQRTGQKLRHILNTHQTQPLGAEARHTIEATLTQLEA